MRAILAALSICALGCGAAAASRTLRASGQASHPGAGGESLDPGAPTMSGLIDHPATEMSTERYPASLAKHSDVWLPVDAGSAWAEVQTELSRFEPHEQAALRCHNTALLAPVAPIHGDADARFSASDYSLTSKPANCCDKFVQYDGQRMPLLPFLGAAFRSARETPTGGSRNMEVSSLLPRAFGGACHGFEATSMGMGRSELVLNHASSPTSDADHLVEALGTLLDSCIGAPDGEPRFTQRLGAPDAALLQEWSGQDVGEGGLPEGEEESIHNPNEDSVTDLERIDRLCWRFPSALTRRWGSSRSRVSMKTLSAQRRVAIPAKVSVEVKGRTVKVTGPRGSLERSFDHIRCVIEVTGKRGVMVSMFSADRRQLACLRTVATHIDNMVTGVTRGFLFKLRMAYSHFPINVDIEAGKGGEPQRVEIRNFLGQKRLRVVVMETGVTAIRSEDVKDQIEVTGNDIELVSKCAARIHQACLVRAKDIRKFLDGIYVCEKGPIGKLVAI
ncbi:hypothetical protein FNF28_01991 [Cafeteria roenbergensis]|uniref:Large ribosomal subunit protein uL6 alpha-beta domain-containing protein n=1 Tax=Cafeteria roenbergensis TaxID=33653 RepID=A0A5A8DVW0_CAFRO|nr:hypothetical protein FNF28_01991 [Cafeteria roenbergensis]